MRYSGAYQRPARIAFSPIVAVCAEECIEIRAQEPRGEPRCTPDGSWPTSTGRRINHPGPAFRMPCPGSIQAGETRWVSPTVPKRIFLVPSDALLASISTPRTYSVFAYRSGMRRGCIEVIRRDVQLHRHPARPRMPGSVGDIRRIPASCLDAGAARRQLNPGRLGG